MQSIIHLKFPAIASGVLFHAMSILALTSLVVRSETPDDLARHVNPFVGTSGTGHTFPGATTPMGMVQLSPQTNNFGWEYASGYQFKDSTLIGFAHTHLSGTGWMDLGDVLMLPFAGQAKRAEYRTALDKTTEKATPGYYAVTLPDEKVHVELTASKHCGIHRYTYLEAGASNILVDLQSGLVGDRKLLDTHVLDSTVKIEGPRTISGHVRSRHWVEQEMFFVIELGKDVAETKFLDGGLRRKLCLSFMVQKDEVIETRVGISTVSVDGAKRNLRECDNLKFDAIRDNTRSQWNGILGKITIDGDDDQKANFYTSMYHLFVQPNNIADVDGSYRGGDGKVRQSPSRSYYSTLSIWDTYRAAHPLYTLLVPDRNKEIVESMLAHFDATGMLPVWTVWGQDNFCMIGNHGVVIVADAFLKGHLDADTKARAYAAVRQTLTRNSWEKYDWRIYDRYGYLPADLVKTESVSRTLESTTDDWCAAQMAKALGREDDFRFFTKRSQYYRNLHDPSSGMMRPKNSDGSWVEPFDPLEFSPGGGSVGYYTEGNAWQYFWHVQHDIGGLIDLVGGKDAFAMKLDTLFSMESAVRGEGSLLDITGMIGQYVHGNEPSHHVAYLYNQAGMPWKTQELIPRILKSQYRNAPDGLCGNDDCGQMSAWFVFSTLGFYPVNPASGVFDIGVPSLPFASIKLGGKSFDVRAHHLSPTNCYVRSIKLNGKPLDGWRITYDEIMRGGLLEFEMTDSSAIPEKQVSSKD